MTTLKDIKEYYKSVFHLEDDFIIDVILATALGIRTNGEQIWLMVVGSSSSGKSEVIQILGNLKFVFQVSNLTENTFLSGMPPRDGKETSLLKRMGKRGVIVMKDYTSILSMRKEKREIISSQMREIYDGHFTKETGNGVNPEWTGKINFIGGVTDSIYSSEGESAGMGRRAIMYCMPVQNRKKTLDASRKNTNDCDEKRLKIKGMVYEYMTEIESRIPLVLPPLNEDFSQELMELADFSTWARSPTERDYRGNLTLVHDAEMPMRVSQQLHLLAQVLTFMYNGTLPEEVKAGLRRIAFDNIPKLRKNALLILAKYKAVTSKGIAHFVDYPSDTARVWLEDLNALKVCKRTMHGQSKMDLFSLMPEARAVILKYRPEIEVVDDYLLGTEEDLNSYYGAVDSYSMDAEILKANQNKANDEFQQLGF